MRRCIAPLAGVAALLISVPQATTSVHAGWLSQQEGSSHASIGASVEVSSRTPGTSAHSVTPPAPSSPAGPASGGGAPEPPAMPTISTSSPLYRNPHPSGSETFWYPPAGGQRCMYVPGSNGVCFNVTAPATGRPAAPAVNPAALAASLAASMDLRVGGIVASPSARMAGLTGAASWFWLSPPPAGRSLSVSLAGESVTVSAVPSTVRWSFGDGAQLAGGPGVPYRPGAVPAAAILHAYKTRCLPGDQGHDPYVLSSCGANGYQVAASVLWSISFQASGPVSSRGALPSRATSTSTVYPVSEARAFLTSGGGR